MRYPPRYDSGARGHFRPLLEPGEIAVSGKFTLSAVATVLLLSPAPLLAGGLPRVCLPVNGVTTGNANACAKLIGNAISKAERIELRENDAQWYALFSVNGSEVDLDKLDAAFKGSAFSVPRDTLRLFGGAKLEIEVAEASEQKLLTDLKAVKYLTIDATKRDRGVLSVTVILPYPRHTGREVEDFGKASFAKELFGAERSDFAPKADPPATARTLPTHADLRAVVEKHDGRLKGTRLNLLGCHVQGGILVPDATAKPQ